MQRRTDGLADDELGMAVGTRLALVDEDEVTASEVVDESRRRVDDERGAADDERVRRADGGDCARDGVVVEMFLIENDIGADDAATFAVGDGRVLHDVVERVVRAAVHAVRAADRAVQLTVREPAA